MLFLQTPWFISSPILKPSAGQHLASQSSFHHRVDLMVRRKVLNAYSENAKGHHVSYGERLAHFTWAWFECTMSTGAMAALLSLQPYTFPGLKTIGKVVFIIDLVLFISFTILITMRFGMNRGALTKSLHHPHESLLRHVLGEPGLDHLLHTILCCAILWSVAGPDLGGLVLAFRWLCDPGINLPIPCHLRPRAVARGRCDAILDLACLSIYHPWSACSQSALQSASTFLRIADSDRWHNFSRLRVVFRLHPVHLVRYQVDQRALAGGAKETGNVCGSRPSRCVHTA